MPNSERVVHARLRETLDDSFVVFHSVAWHGRGAKPDGEIDFVVAHPTLGLLLLEVKGGEIAINPKTGVWTSRNEGGEVNVIKDPYAQALTAKHELVDEIRADARWPGGRRCQIGYGVVLPRATLGADRPPRAKPEITFESRDLHDLGAKVQACLRYWQQVDPAPRPGADGIAALLRMYGTSMSFRVPLSEILAEDERRIIELTEQQFRLLDLLDRHRRVAVAGCAGSGKTLLAFEKARRLAESGRRVLLTCFNKGLAGYLREQMEVPRGLEIRHFHELCADLVQEVGVVPPPGAEEGPPFLEWLPDGLFEALAQSQRRFDAIVVDEGQDFASPWFDVLEASLEDGARGHFYVFYDDNQRLYSSDPIPDWLGEPYQLTVDCRNTNQIGELVRSLYRGPAMDLSGIVGRPVVYLPYPDTYQPSQVATRVGEALGQLRNAGAQAKDVVVLSPRREGPTWQRRDFGDWRLYRPDQPDGNVYYDTIHGFKGQESRIVVLVELETAGAARPGLEQELDELLYVGCSRPTTQLAIVAAESAVRRLRALQAAGGAAS